MAEAKECPKCKLVNPAAAERCDCGWDFLSKSMEKSYANLDARASRNNRLAYVAGLFGFLIMTLSGLKATLNPQPDGRILNTAPAIGVDLFLFVGLLGFAYCGFKLLRRR